MNRNKATRPVGIVIKMAKALGKFGIARLQT